MALLFGNKRVVSNTLDEECIMQESQLSTSDDHDHLGRQKICNLVKNVCPSNIEEIIRLLLLEDLISFNKVFCFQVLDTSMDSPDSISSLALLVASINVDIPDIGFVLLKQIVLELCSACEHKDIPTLKSLSELLAHLVNFRVVNGLLAGQFLMALLEKYDEHCVEVAGSFILECGYVLHKSYRRVLYSVFERLMVIYWLKVTKMSSRPLIWGLFLIRNDDFDGFKVEIPEFYLAKLHDQVMHEIPIGFRSEHDSLVDLLKDHLDFVVNDNSEAQ